MQSYIAVLHAGMVKKVAYDDTGSVNTVAVSRCGAGKIELRESAVLIKESVAITCYVSKAAHNKT